MTERTQWSINPDTMALEGGPTGRLTGGQWNAQQWPPCPVCGTTVNVDRVDAREWLDQVPMYLMGGWECPNGDAFGPRRVAMHGRHE